MDCAGTVEAAALLSGGTAPARPEIGWGLPKEKFGLDAPGLVGKEAPAGAC